VPVRVLEVHLVVLHELVVHHRGVAVHVAFESKGLKPGYHISGSWFETRRFQSPPPCRGSRWRRSGTSPASLYARCPCSSCPGRSERQLHLNQAKLQKSVFYHCFWLTTPGTVRRAFKRYGCVVILVRSSTTTVCHQMLLTGFINSCAVQPPP
jgi:hypothetical protein